MKLIPVTNEYGLKTGDIIIRIYNGLNILTKKINVYDIDESNFRVMYVTKNNDNSTTYSCLYRRTEIFPNFDTLRYFLLSLTDEEKTILSLRLGHFL